jgi:hypothetical protein
VRCTAGRHHGSRAPCARARAEQFGACQNALNRVVATGDENPAVREHVCGVVFAFRRHHPGRCPLRINDRGIAWALPVHEKPTGGCSWWSGRSAPRSARIGVVRASFERELSRAGHAERTHDVRRRDSEPGDTFRIEELDDVRNKAKSRGARDIDTVAQRLVFRSFLEHEIVLSSRRIGSMHEIHVRQSALVERDPVNQRRFDLQGALKRELKAHARCRVLQVDGPRCPIGEFDPRELTNTTTRRLRDRVDTTTARTLKSSGRASGENGPWRRRFRARGMCSVHLETDPEVMDTRPRADLGDGLFVRHGRLTGRCCLIVRTRREQQNECYELPHLPPDQSRACTPTDGKKTTFW